MADYKLVDVAEKQYLYVARKCSMDPEVVGETMGKAFQDVMAFMQENAIAPAGPPLSVYYTYDPETLDFRSGFFVKAEDAGKARGQVQTAKTPAGRVLALTHVGPYRDLRKTYDAMTGYIEEQKLALGAPTWEVYIDDPDSTPEDELRTEIFVSVMSHSVAE